MAGRKDVYQKAMNQGHSAAWDQSWEQAAGYYRQALAEFPESGQALTSLGLALYEMQRPEESLKTYLQAARAAPDDPIPMEKASEISERLGYGERAIEFAFRSAELYARMRDVEKAIENWTRVIRLSPEHIQAHSRLALVYERMGRTQQAITEYISVASLQQHAGNANQALQTLEHAAQVAPGNTQVVQAVALMKARRLLPKPLRPRGGTAPLRPPASPRSEARPAEELAASRTSPVNEAQRKALAILAGMLFDAPKDEKAATERKGLQAVVHSLTGSAGRQVDFERIAIHLTQVMDFQSRGREGEAAAELEKAISQGLDHPAAYFDLGLLQSRAERLESATRNLRKAASDGEFALAAFLVMGKAYHQAGDLRSAGAEYLRALRLADALVVPPGQADGLRQLYDPIIEAQAESSDEPGHRRICENVEEMLSKDNWIELLTRAREQLPRGAPGSPPLPLAGILTAASSSQVVDSLSAINRLAQQGRWRSAMDEAFWAIQHAPTYLPLHTYVGELLIHQGYVKEAIEKFAVISRAYSVRGEFRAATEMVRRIIELSPMDLKARRQLIDQLVASRQVPEAIQETISLAGVHYSRAELDLARQAYASALILTQQPGIDPAWKVSILHQMADIDMQSLDFRQALRVYEQIRTLKPEDDKARYNLVDLYMRLGQQPQAMAEVDGFLASLVEKRQIDKAFTFLEEVVKERPEVIAIRHRLGELYRQAGRNEQAIQHLDAVADLMMKAGDKTGAVKVVRSILKMNPPQAEKYQAFLNQLGL
jgi:tetratricopeptide (TPR) repeat protein